MNTATSSLREQVAEEVRALLARRRLSARKAAEALGKTEWYMSRRMTGKTAFDIDDLAALADLLDVPVTDFFPVRMGRGNADYPSRPVLTRESLAAAHWSVADEMIPAA